MSEFSDFIGDKYVYEPFLEEDDDRLAFYPIKDRDLYNILKKSQASYWVPEEIDMKDDYAHWDKLNENVKYFISMIVAFFAGSDELVKKIINNVFINDIKNSQINDIYTFQSMMENIHSEMYAILVDTYIKDPKEKEYYFNAIKKIPCIAKKAEWSLKWAYSKKKFHYRLITNAITEGLFFSGAFCAIYWIKEMGILPGLTTSNSLISRDEGLHTTTGCVIYSKMKNKLKESVVYEILDEAVAIEKEFICVSLPCKLIGMNSDMMSQYIEYVADILLVNLGYNKKYNVLNPFKFMEKIGLESVINFFEHRVTEYQKKQISEKIDYDSIIKSALSKQDTVQEKEEEYPDD